MHEVAAVVAAEPAFVGTEHGASIGGFPLQPSVQEGFLAHPSSALGIETPDFDEDDEG